MAQRKESDAPQSDHHQPASEHPRSKIARLSSEQAEDVTLRGGDGAEQQKQIDALRDDARG